MGEKLYTKQRVFLDNVFLNFLKINNNEKLKDEMMLKIFHIH